MSHSRAWVAAAFVAMILVATPLSANAKVHLHDGSIVNIFTDDEIKRCYKMRTPNVVATKAAHHVVARCCGKNMCGGALPPEPILPGGSPRMQNLGDDDSDCSMVMKTSSDGGSTWGNFQTLSPNGQQGYSNGGAFYDSRTDSIIAIYQKWSSNRSDRIFQIVSKDEGKTWTQPTEITTDLSKCEPSAGDQVTIGAGSKLHTKNGTLVSYHHGGYTVVYLSHDNGASWTCSQQLPSSLKEMSFAQIDGPNPNHIVSTIRTKHSPLLMTSIDGGKTWTNPQTVSDLPGVNCESSLLGMNSTLFWGSPLGVPGEKRAAMHIYCSTDGGSTWKNSVSINGNNDGAYSDMKPSGNDILFVWENTHVGNIAAAKVDTSFCH